MRVLLGERGVVFRKCSLQDRCALCGTSSRCFIYRLLISVYPDMLIVRPTGLNEDVWLWSRHTPLHDILMGPDFRSTSVCCGSIFGQTLIRLLQ